MNNRKDIGCRGFNAVALYQEGNIDPFKLVNIQTYYENVYNFKIRITINFNISLTDYVLREESDGHKFNQH